MRWTHKHVRKVAYTLLALISAIPTVGLWLFIAGVVALELGLRKGWYANWCVAVRDDKPKAKIKELQASADPKAWVAQEAADRAGTALVDGFLYMYGPTVLLLIATLSSSLAFLPKEFLENAPLIDMKKTLSTTSGWIIFLASSWMIWTYLGRYSKTLKALKKMGADAALELYKKLSGPLKISAYILLGVTVALYILLTKLGVSSYIRSVFLLIPTVWPLVYFFSYKQAKAKLERDETINPLRG